MAFADDDEGGNQGNDTPKENAQQQIQKLAITRARELGHAKATFNHLLYALIKKDPAEIDSLLNPRLKSSVLLNMVEKDLKQRSKTLGDDDSSIEFSTEASRALKRAEVISGKNWSSDKIFAAELLHAMLEAGKVGEVPDKKTGQDQAAWEKIRDEAMNERSPTLDYVRMILSNHTALDAGVECRKLIDQFAAARGEKSQQKQLTAGKSAQNNGESSMPNKSAYIIPLKKDSLLSEFAQNLNQRAENGDLDPVTGRDDEISQVIKVLARRRKNNPVLLGEAGVGKTAVVEGLVQRMNKGDVPEFLKTKNIIQLDLSLIVAGTKYRGQFEERLKNIMKELQEQKDLIVFMDEIHTMIGAGAAEGSMDAANILKPALARGEITAIGSTTLNEYKKSIEKDAAMERRFQPVKVDPPKTLEKTVEMLQAVKDKYAEFHGITYSDAVVTACADMSTRYLGGEGKNQPDLGITLMDDVGARAKIEGRDPVIEDVAAEIHEKTHIPVGEITTNDVEAAETLGPYLKSKVFHQDHAIDAFVDIVAASRAGASDENKPIGSFLWLGPTGVGKTELVKQAAKKMGINIVRLDMSEYQEKHTTARMIGAPPGYVGYEEGGQLTEKVKRNPYSIILLDEIEKAHPDVLNLLLQMLDDGQMTDGLGHKIDFKHCIVVMTSNATAGVIDAPGLDTPGEAKKTDSKVTDALVEKGFRPELLNRIDEITEFNALPIEAMPRIVKRIIAELSERRNLRNLQIEVGKGVVSYLVNKEFNAAYGARPYKRLVNKELGVEFSKAIRSKQLDPKVPTIAEVTLNEAKNGLDIKFRAAAAPTPAASISYDAEGDGLVKKPGNDAGRDKPSNPAVG